MSGGSLVKPSAPSKVQIFYLLITALAIGDFGNKAIDYFVHIRNVASCEFTGLLYSCMHFITFQIHDVEGKSLIPDISFVCNYQNESGTKMF